MSELNPSDRDATVYNHIQKPIDAGIVKEVALDDHSLLSAEETLQQIYDTTADKPEKMLKYENAPRLNEK